MSVLRPLFVVASLAALAASAIAVRQEPAPAREPGSSGSDEESDPIRDVGVAWLRVELPTREAFHPILGRHAFETHQIWKSVCAGDPTAMSQRELERYVARHAELTSDQMPKIVIDDDRTLVPGGIDIVFIASGSIPSGAPAALAAAEAYLESTFTADSLTVTVPVTFQPMASNVLGGTSSSYGYLTYTDTRAVITGNMDASDTIQGFLPTGSTLPVRYNGNNGQITNEDRVFFTFANYEATGGTVAGDDANMTFNSNFAFDYDPSNGVSGSTYSFQDVVVHETGHALGCTSGGDFRFKDSEVLDLFRFQRTDGNGDYNPDTTAEFQVRARLVSYNKPNDDHNTDIVSAEYRMSDGSPYQMSHLREQSPNIGLMDPALAAGETHYPAFFSAADIDLFDAISYDK
jgi:hypothetical protein